MNIIASTKSQNETVTDTTCPYCGVGCGVRVTQNEEGTTVSGREEHPANQGRLCVKGSSLHETIDLKGRLLAPQVNGQSTSWDAALDYTAERFKKTIETYGPDSVAFYLSGQLLTEDYYVANKLMKGFIGSANIDTNSRLCMASAVVAHKRAFGADVVPGCYEDLEKTDVLFFVGSNAAYAHPIVFQRIVKAKKERGMKVVVLDPRRTATCDIADLHLPIKPGSDAFFYNGLLGYLADNNKVDQEYIAEHCDGYEETLAAAKAQVPDLASAAALCDVNEDELALAYAWFADNERVVSLFSQGVNQSSSGVDKGNALINCHLATGKIGREGAAPFSITGQPNAMGGREVGGLANQLAAHMSFTQEDITVVEEFWQAPNIAKEEGLRAVDLFDAVHDGRVKAVWIMGTNPVVSMPNAGKVKEALEKCDLVVVSDCMEDTDTTRLADVLLPATTWGEKQGMVTNSDRTISLQKPFLPAPGESRNDWQIISAFAQKMGFENAFDYQHSSEIFAEHAALSGFKVEQNLKRAFDISRFASISQADYENFEPIQWPVKSNQIKGTKRLFEEGQFFTDTGKAQLVPVVAQLPKIPANDDQFVMNTGRIRDQWHTMTRTGKASRLLSHTSEPYVQIHPDDAERLGIKDKGIVECSNLGQQYLGRAKLSTDQRQGEVFLPMHWNAVFAAQSRSGALVNDVVDPLCGQPEFKHTPIDLRAYETATQGLIVSRQLINGMNSEYWSKIPLSSGQAMVFADVSGEQDWDAWLKAEFPHIQDWVTLNGAGQHYRALGFVDGQLALAFIAGDGQTYLPDHDFLSSQLGQEIPAADRFTLLAGVPGDDSNSPGPIVCSCFQIGENQIRAMVEEGVDTVEALGEKLKCGTNCGSCIPELSSLIAKSSA